MRFVSRSGSFEVPFFGMTYRGRLDSFIDRSVYCYGAYEHELLELAGGILNPGAVVMDVGANTGQHSLFFSRRAAHVHAFEPWAPLCESIEEKIALNGLRNITVHRYGLGDKSGTIPFFAPHDENHGSGSFVPEHSPGNREMLLPVVRGDEFGATLTRLDLVKIDVEGFEPEVIRGLRATLARLRPAVLFECSTTTRCAFPTVASILAALPAGYEIYRITTRRVVAGLFERPTHTLTKAQRGDAPEQEILAVDGLHHHNAVIVSV